MSEQRRGVITIWDLLFAMLLLMVWMIVFHAVRYYQIRDLQRRIGQIESERR